MLSPTDRFRVRYRAGISRHYHGLLHGVFVLAYGAAWIGFFVSQVNSLRNWEWLAIAVGLVLFNLGEYGVHRGLGHRKHALGKLFYKRHTGDHHSFFVMDRMPFESLRDWRVVLFPAWLIVLFSLLALVLWALLSLWNANVAALLSATLLGGYLLYEVMHLFEHLPDQHPIARLPGIAHMRHLHALHHRRDLMTTRNFNLVFPLTDWLLGTLHWEPMPRKDQ